MKTNSQSGRLSFWCCLVMVFFCVSVAQAAIVDLIAYVSYSLLNSSGAPLADGSIVMIFGSGDDINNGPESFGDALIADSTQGDDVYLGMVRIDAPSYGNSNGTFYTANNFSFDDDTIHYLYIRFFNTTNYPIQNVYTQWNTSSIFGFTSEFNKVTVDFVGNYMTSVTNQFVVIPEPSTSHLLVVFFGLALGMRAVMKKDDHKQRKPNGR